MRQRKNIGYGKVAVTAYAGAALVAAIAVYYGARALQAPNERTVVVARDNPTVGSIIVPDNNGKCIKAAFNNRTGQMSEGNTVECAAAGSGSGSILPPNLKGFQDTFRGR